MPLVVKSKNTFRVFARMSNDGENPFVDVKG